MTTSARRRVLAGFALATAMLIVGICGYLAAGWADTSSVATPPAGHQAGPGGHVMPDGRTMTDGQTMAADPGPSTGAADDMSGMDMHGQDMHGMDMGGMDMGGQASAVAGDHGAGPPSEPRPLAAVLGTFGVLNGGVLLAAATLRRRERSSRRERTRGRPGTAR